MNSEYIKISKFIKNMEKSVEDLEKRMKLRDKRISKYYIYQTEKNIDARLLESWFINTLKPELDIVYPNKELILKNISVDRKPTLVADKYLLIRARKQGNTAVMSLSRFVEAGKFYTVKKQEDHSIIIREADVKKK